MRHHLVMKFVCAKCGAMLNLSYDKPKNSGNSDCSDEITGAAKVESIYAIEPCYKCLEPARKIMEAVKTLTSESV